MRSTLLIFGFLFLILLVGVQTDTAAKEVYGILVPANTIDSFAALQINTQLHQNFIANPKVDEILFSEQLREVKNYDVPFWAFLFVLAIPAVFKYINPGYFKNIFVAFRNPNLSARHLREQLSQNSLASMVMDVFFNITFGLYTYQLLKYANIKPFSFIHNDIILLLFLIISFGLVYFFRYVFLKITGYLFHIEEHTDTYIFNIFLINKILAVSLLPFIAAMSFGTGSWIQAVMLCSFLLIVTLFVVRYIRSASLFRYFLQTSKFHFFLYLCASEILPIIIIAKFIIDLI